MIQDLNLYINLQGRGLVSSPNDSTSPALSFMQGDTYRLVLNGLMPVLDNSLTLFASAHIQWSRLSAGITLIDAAPTGGSFVVKVGSDLTAVTSGTLTFNIGKGELEAALNAVSLVATAGGMNVVNSGASNIYRLNWRIPANALALVVVENALSPLSLSRVANDPDVPGKVELKLYQAPVTLTDQFTLPTAPAITVSQVRSGSTLRNEVQRITVPVNAIGSFALDWLNVAGTIIPVATVTAASIDAAINDPFYALNSTDQRFSVTNPASGIFDLEFVGAYARTAGFALIGIEMFDQVPIDTPVGIMTLDNQAIEDFLDGAATGRAYFEIRAYDSDGNKTMLAHLPVTLINDGIDDQVLSQVGTIATRVDTVYVYPDPTDPTAAATQAMAIARLGTQFTNPALAQNFVFNHTFATMAVDVTVLVKTATLPDTWQLVPDDQFEVDILNDSQVQVFFGTDIPAAPAVGSVQVWLCTLNATPILNEHRHNTDAIDGVTPDAGNTLTQIIANLRASLPTGWPNIPANKISGTLDASQINLTSLAQAFTSSSDFLTTLRTLILDQTLVSYLSTALAINSDFLTTLETSMSNTTLLTQLISNLATNTNLSALTIAIAGTPAFAGAVTSVVGTLQIPGAMTLPIAPISEILFSTSTFSPSAANTRAPFMLPQIVVAIPTSLTTIALPTIAANSVWINNSGSSLSIPGGGGIRSGTVATAGFIGSDGRIFYPVSKRLTTNSYFPEAFKRELWRLWIDDKMLPVGKTFSVQFAVGLQLINTTCNAQYVLVIEKGTADSETSGSSSPENLMSITWDEINPLVKQRIILTQNLMSHSFGANIVNATTGLTAQGNYYGNSYTAPAAPVSANFLLRARLIEFDTENSVSSARGWVSYSLQPDSYGQLGAKIA